MKKNVTTVGRMREEFRRQKKYLEPLNLRKERQVGTREVEIVEAGKVQGILDSIKNPIKAEWEFIYD